MESNWGQGIAVVYHHMRGKVLYVTFKYMNVYKENVWIK